MNTQHHRKENCHSMKRALYLPAALLTLLIAHGCAAKNETDTNAISQPSQQKSEKTVPIVSLPSGSIDAPLPNEKKQIAGAGSSFASHFYDALIPVFQKRSGVTISYDPVGSTTGVKSLINQEVNFAGTDVPLNQEQMSLAKGGAVIHVPTALGAVAVSFNLPGVKTLYLTPEILSEIYLGRITRWNDPKLVALNSVLSGANQEIIVVYRGDGSGTSFAFTEYLSNVSAVWRNNVGPSSTANWPVGIDADGNSGVAETIIANPYSIGYLELGTAIKKKLPVSAIRNAAGNFVAPTLESVSSAAAEIAQFAPADLRFSLANAAGSGSYPISTATWAAVYKNQTDCPAALAVSRFLWFTTHEGQAATAQLNYAALPQSLVKRSEAAIASITCNGQPVFRLN
jgi:phosphate transport system substrate-binding protein